MWLLIAEITAIACQVGRAWASHLIVNFRILILCWGMLFFLVFFFFFFEGALGARCILLVYFEALFWNFFNTLFIYSSKNKKKLLLYVLFNLLIKVLLLVLGLLIEDWIFHFSLVSSTLVWLGYSFLLVSLFNEFWTLISKEIRWLCGRGRVPVT